MLASQKGAGEGESVELSIFYLSQVTVTHQVGFLNFFQSIPNCSRELRSACSLAKKVLITVSVLEFY